MISFKNKFSRKNKKETGKEEAATMKEEDEVADAVGTVQFVPNQVLIKMLPTLAFVFVFFFLFVPLT